MFSREVILRCYGIDAEVCYLGIDMTRFVDHGWPREDILVGLGAFSPWKNIKLIIEALALVPAPRPTLAWIGNSSTDDYLREMIQLARVARRAFVPHERISDEGIVELL